MLVLGIWLKYTEECLHHSLPSTLPSTPCASISIWSGPAAGILFLLYYGYDTLTEFIIYYHQQAEGDRLSMTFESNLKLLYRYWYQKVIISGLMGGATYSVSVVAVSFTLHSDETTAVNITIGIYSTCFEPHLISIIIIVITKYLLLFCRVSSNIYHLPSFLNCWEYCQSHLLH